MNNDLLRNLCALLPIIPGGVIDQADSIIGGALVLSIYTPLSTYHFWLLVLVASAIHYTINVIMYFVRLKSQA